MAKNNVKSFKPSQFHIFWRYIEIEIEVPKKHESFLNLIIVQLIKQGGTWSFSTKF